MKKIFTLIFACVATMTVMAQSDDSTVSNSWGLKGSGTQGDRINRGVFWHVTKRPNFRFRGRRGSLRSRIRILPPRDPPGDGGRREGGGQVFTGTQLHTL